MVTMVVDWDFANFSESTLATDHRVRYGKKSFGLLLSLNSCSDAWSGNKGSANPQPSFNMPATRDGKDYIQSYLMRTAATCPRPHNFEWWAEIISVSPRPIYLSKRTESVPSPAHQLICQMLEINFSPVFADSGGARRLITSLPWRRRRGTKQPLRVSVWKERFSFFWYLLCRVDSPLASWETDGRKSDLKLFHLNREGFKPSFCVGVEPIRPSWNDPAAPFSSSSSQELMSLASSSGAIFIFSFMNSNALKSQLNAGSKNRKIK